ncbi:NTF2 domain-containing protein [Madurella fahalii]|uniref:NTF2 domain-containing protein n=1 Tax=Madurella fahalii TaxID=1157608 RepID=A0ABQ0FY28_9PEZI
MALQDAYKQFLAAPNSSALAEDASLHYVTTTSSFAGATDIIKHLAALRNKIKKKKEEALFALEARNVLVLEAETTLEFVTSGGPYLPGLDDNFLADRTVYLLVTHIVTFDGEGKIAQIRQSWDQGSLLKQVEVIGRSGQNWPIRDSKEQINLVAKCVKGAGVDVGRTESLPTRSRGGSTNILRDPHASLDLFAPREEDENPEDIVSPYAGRRPRQRSFTEILGDEPEEEPGSPSNGRERSQSPSKAIAPKIGSGKHFQPMRIFEKDEDNDVSDTPEKTRSPERFIRPNPKKYQHFDFDDGSEAPPAPAAQPTAGDAAKKSKRDSQWSFEDFVTPQKPTASRIMHRARDVRHWGTENDLLENTPVPNAHVPKPRRDAEVHFELVDDGPASKGPRNADRPPRGTLHNEGLHLYENRLHTEDGADPNPGPPPLGNITNLKDRRKDFEAHFNLTDESPHNSNGDEPAKVSEDRKKAVRMMESSWSSYDKSPVSQKENNNPEPARTGNNRGIAIAGDGMGGKKGAGRGWFIGDDDEQDVPKKVGRGPPTKSDGFWDF